jgi:hypothetical protein
VFIIVDCTDGETGWVLSEKGIPVSFYGCHGMPYPIASTRCRGARVDPFSVSVGARDRSGEVFHTVDFVVRTTRDRIAGQCLMITYQSPGGAGLDPILLSVAPAVATYPLLYRMGGR